MGHLLTDFLIGTGGWAYFKIPSMHPLAAYSRAFNFVEVNSTFYEIPASKNVETWRRIVPKDFEFTVRCNKRLTHELKFESTPETFEILDNMVEICSILKAKVLHFQTPHSFNYDKINSEKVKDFFESAKLKNLRIALETRSPTPLDPIFVKTLYDLNVIHCIDLLKGTEPVYRSDILYTRLFGKGSHNIYQPLDSELKQVAQTASKEGTKKAIITMHSNRMFKDAARFRIYKDTGKFPMVTKSVGVNSLAEVLKEDVKFPSTKTELLDHQGWKLIDLTPQERVHASDLLQKLPEKTYYRIDDIIQLLGDKNFE
jgi:uncharacterized protein YecE (DUF72 family)